MDVREKIIASLSQYGNAVNGNFGEAGINSIEFIKLVVKLEKELGIEVDEDMLDIDKIPSFDALCDAL